MISITDDFNAVKRCKSPAEFKNFTRCLSELKAERIALDFASPDLTNYPTRVGTVTPTLQASRFYRDDPNPLATIVPEFREPLEVGELEIRSG